MTRDERDRLTMVETRVAELADDMREIKADVKSIAAMILEAKGGGRAVLLIASVSGVLGALAAKLLPFFKS